MRIPLYFKSPLWQRFFAGAAAGGIISWLMFFYMHSIMQEKLIQKLHKQGEYIKDLEEENALWEEDYNKLNDKNLERLTIQEVKVTVTNFHLYKIDRLSVAEAVEKIQDDLNSTLLSKDLETVYEARSLLKKSIENKVLEINKKKYMLEVSEVLYYTTLKLEVKLKQVR
ncbi:sporulation membrane protein YtrI [Peribacillus deserti]|uniref:Sporulation protein n=1 Tax=Peribacillus deserti TaxID=673318 RepID=A0A2N5M9X7_9BACI|nr:sporulation membrane protein YtrI [Peribacillus deserti]PLT31170.1 sporulation protein [Peribacillus deserti]